MKRKKISIIGSTKVSESHIDSFRKANIEVISCASSLNSNNIKNFSKKNDIDKFFLNPFELIENNDWDGLIIASSIKAIPSLLNFALKKNKPILVEKPVDLGIKYLKNFSTSLIKNVNVAYNRRYYSTISFAKKFISRSNECIVNVKIPEQIHLNISNKLSKFHNVYANACHVIDLMFYLLGNDLKIIQKHDILGKNGRLVILKSKNNYCNLLINSNSPDNFSIEIEDGKKRLLLKPIEKLFLYEGMSKLAPTTIFPLRTYKPKLTLETNIFMSQKYNLKPGFYEQAMDFKRILNSKESKISAKLIDAYRVQKLINQII